MSKKRQSKIPIRANVLVSDPHPMSRGSYERLVRYYRSKRDFDIVRPQWRRWLSFRSWVLRNEKRRRGRLECYFCGSTPLVANTLIVGPMHQATLDHVVPRAKGGGEYDVTNLVVCCRSCNQRKRHMSVQAFMAKSRAGDKGALTPRT